MVTTAQPKSNQASTKKQAPPEATWLQEEATKLHDLWQPQKKRMNEDKLLWQLTRQEPDEGESNVVLNDPRVLINKVARMLASAEWRAVFDPDLDPVPSFLGPVSDRDDSATVKEKFVTWAWEQADEINRDGLNVGLKQTLFKQGLVRGMMAVRVKPAMVDPDAPEGEEQFPYDIQAIDPVNLYYRPRGRGIGYFVHVYEAEWASVAEDWGIEDDSHKDDDVVKVIGFYSDIYWAVMVDGDYIKEPEEHGLGFNPIVAAIAEGGEFRNDEYTTGNQWTAFHGVGLLEDIRQTILDRNRTATMRDEMITRTINPSYLTWTDDGKPIVIDLRNGANNPLNNSTRDEVRLLSPGAASPDLAKAEADLDSRIQWGTVPRVLFGEMDSPLSGYATSLTSKNARDILDPWIDCYSGLVQRVNVRLLKMVSNPDIGIDSTLTISGKNSKLGRFRERIQASAIGQDFSHKVEVGDVLPSDLPAILGMAVQAIEKDVLSRRTILEKLLTSVVTDSKGELVNIIREKAALRAGDQIAQLGIAALKITMGEQGMTDAFGQATEAPAPAELPAGPTAGMAPNILPPAETGIAPTQIAPGSPEEAAIQQRIAAGG